ncbi:MAG TPA: PAS domain S-box protein, partial [Pyrinomonadaceae bacterium]|nr:PAS domain S-box protein [Pyrinomonadaceae bacterium]
MDGGKSIALLQRPKFEVKPVNHHWVFRYGLAILLVAATIGLSLLLNHFGIKLNFTIPVVVALVVGSWYGGRGPGLLIGVLFQATTIIFAKAPEDTGTAALIFTYFSTFSLYVFVALLISGLRNVLRRLSEQRDLLQVTLSSIGDGVIATNTSGQVMFMNPMAEQLTGWGEAPARGVPLEDVFCIVNETTGEVVRNPVDQVLATGTVSGLENHTILKSKTGRTIPIDDSAAPIKNGNEIKGVVLVFSDVSERKEAGAVAAKLASIVRSSSDAIISKDLNGIITSWNKGAEQMFGYTAEEAIGSSVTMLMPGDRVNEEPGILERIRRGEVINHYETVRQHKDGHLLDISLNVSPVYDAQGRIIGAAKIARDMTQQKLAESAVREREIMERIVEAQESERHRIAR